MRALDLVPVSEFQLVTETIRRFRMGYVATFGAPQRDDLLYEAGREGRRHPGMEHWLPLFQRADGHAVRLSRRTRRSPSNRRPRTPRVERFRQIADYYEARREALGASRRRRALQDPCRPDRLYLTEAEWSGRLEACRAGPA